MEKNTINQKMTRILSENCNQPYDKVLADTDRDNFLSADEALAYGLIDKVLTSSNETK